MKILTKIIPALFLGEALLYLAAFFFYRPGILPIPSDRVFQAVSLAALIPSAYVVREFVPGKFGMQGFAFLLFSILQIISNMAWEPSLGRFSALILSATALVLFVLSVKSRPRS